MLGNKGGELGFVNRAHLGGSCLSILEQDQRRNAADAKLGRCARVFVHVEFYNFELADIFVSNLLEDWRDHAARSAPLCPEVDQDRDV